MLNLSLNNTIMSTLGFIQNMGPGSMILIVLVILLLFGAKRIPELAKGLGRGIREFKDATKDIQNDLEEGMKDKKK
jgi:sec-independent protein translocase protein TatA